jgi:hypothetical protein
MTGRRRFLVAISVCLALLACAAVAIAATPNEGKYLGKTGQDLKVRIKVNKSHNIPDKGFFIRWKAICKKKDSNGHHLTWGPDSTVNTGKLDVAGDGSFEQSGKYNENSGSYVGHMKGGLNGKFGSPTSATGKFHIRVRVTKNGNYVDTCKKTVSWQVSS